MLKNGRRQVLASHHAAPVRAVFTPAKPSLGEAMGLRDTEDALALRSSVALVMDQGTNEVLFQKNPSAVLPIASITKLMTALVVTDARLPMDEVLTITEEDKDTEKHSSSRLRFGTQLTRQELLLLALMSSENRAASALGRNYPGGLPAFVQAMNRKARELGMNDSHFVDSSGLSSSNVSSAMDLVRMVNAAYRNPTIREFSTQTEHEVNVLGRTQHYVSTNRLVRGGNWDIGLQKTGFISEAGQCLVMQARVNGRNVVMVFLDSVGKLSRFADATRVREWLEHSPAPQPHAFPSSPNLTQTPGGAHAILASQQSHGT
ncbi:peptidase S11 [Cupriavidus sp. UYMU48A]|nr:peptidase S11 [Cupriavidus sp. UYMU48A]